MTQPQRLMPLGSDADLRLNAPRNASGASRRSATTAILDDYAAQPAPARRKGNRHARAYAHVAFSLTVAACDVLVVLLAARLAEWAYIFTFETPYAPNAMSAVGCFAAALFVLANAMRREYEYERYLQIRGHAARSAPLWALVVACILAIGFAAKMTDHFSRGAITAFFCLGLPMLIGVRIVIVRLTREIAGQESALSRRVFLVGYPEEIAAFRARAGAMLGIEIVGVFNLRRRGLIVADAEAAAFTARALRPDDVFMILPWSHKRTIEACAEAFRKLPVALHLGPEDMLSRFNHAKITEIGCLPIVSLARGPRSHGEVLLKRAIDVVGASLGLVLLAPLFALVAILIKLDSPGGAFFMQSRHGFNQEPFRILKFRTMTTSEDGACVAQAQKNDVRVTRIGRWLRRFNIDELPQLLNVLRGEMSLVGPRPHALAHDAAFAQYVALYARRHNMKPGITGWAQVNGYRGEIRTQADIIGRVEHDLYYLDNWSIWLDVECLWRTIVSPKAYCNAY